MRGSITGAAKDTTGCSRSRIDGGSNGNAARRAAVVPAKAVFADRSLTLAKAIIDDYIIPVDALLPAATLQRDGSKQYELYGTRSLHKIYCGFAEVNWRSSAAVLS